MLTPLNIYLIGVVIAFFAVLISSYYGYNKITIEDLILAIASCGFSWVTAIIIPLIIAVDNPGFLNKTLIERKKKDEKINLG